MARSSFVPSVVLVEPDTYPMKGLPPFSSAHLRLTTSAARMALASTFKSTYRCMKIFGSVEAATSAIELMFVARRMLLTT